MTARKQAAEALGEVAFSIQRQRPKYAVRPSQPHVRINSCFPLPPRSTIRGRFPPGQQTLYVSGCQSCGRFSRFLQREWASRAGCKGPRAKRQAAASGLGCSTEVRSRFSLLYEDINPVIAELLGVDISRGPEEALERAKRVLHRSSHRDRGRAMERCRRSRTQSPRPIFVRRPK